MDFICHHAISSYTNCVDMFLTDDNEFTSLTIYPNQHFENIDLKGSQVDFDIVGRITIPKVIECIKCIYPSGTFTYLTDDFVANTIEF